MKNVSNGSGILAVCPPAAQGTLTKAGGTF